MKLSKLFALTTLSACLMACGDKDPEKIATNLEQALGTESDLCLLYSDVTKEMSEIGEVTKAFHCQVDYRQSSKNKYRSADVIFVVFPSSRYFETAQAEMEKGMNDSRHNVVYKGNGFVITDGGIEGMSRNDVNFVKGDSKSANIIWFADYNDSRYKDEMSKELLEKFNKINTIISKL